MYARFGLFILFSGSWIRLRQWKVKNVSETGISTWSLLVVFIVAYKACFIRRSLVASNAIKTIDNERNSRLMPCLWYIFRLLAHTLVHTRTILNPKAVQFPNRGFSLSDQNILISQSFVEFSKNCAGFLWIFLRCVALWTFLRVELMFFFSYWTPRKPQNLDPANLYNIVEYKQGQVKGLTVWLHNVVLIKQNLLISYDSFRQMSTIYL